MFVLQIVFLDHLPGVILVLPGKMAGQIISRPYNDRGVTLNGGD